MFQPKYKLFENIHELLVDPTKDGETIMTREKYDYYHYGCDGVEDAGKELIVFFCFLLINKNLTLVGYGCGYRTVQSVCSMLIRKLTVITQIPSILDIQKTLVKIGDKEPNFINSRGWIGTLEGSFIFDELFNIPSYIIHIPHDSKISSKKAEIKNYFRDQGGLIFMGGDSDAAAKMITGIHVSKDNQMFLQIVDPHFNGIPKRPQNIVDQSYVRWYAENEFIDNSFYNLCMPKLS